MNNDRRVFINKSLRALRTMTSAVIVVVLVYAGLTPLGRVMAANPASGSIDVNGPVSPWNGQWDATATGGTAPNGEPDCVSGVNCDDFTITVQGPRSSWQGKLIRIRFTWTSPSTDYDMVVRHESNGTPGLQGDGMCTPGIESSCPTPYDEFAGSSGNGASTFEESVISPYELGPTSFQSGSETYYVRAIYFAGNPADQYHAAVTVFNASGGGATVSLVPPTFDNYQPQDPNYPRRDDSGEPSIGINWNTGNVMTMSRLQCNRTSFDDSTSPADPVNGQAWFHRTSQVLVTGLDPILFTDSTTGRTICGELQGAGGSTNGIISDDDLATATQTFQTGGATQGVDHQTIGGGPPRPGISGREPTTAYPHLWYYASQQTAYAAVATSLDGGVTYLPAVPAYTLAQCTNLHGHVKVDPSGTVYLPNRSCGGHAAVIVSEDNGLNWSVREVPTSSAGDSDDSVGIGSGGRLYLGYTNGSQHPHIAVSDDHGLTWHDDTDLSPLAQAQFPVTTGAPNAPLRAAAFPQVVAGDNNRAAIFFLATNSTDQGGNGPTGDDNGGATPGFRGTWYPFIATTADGGVSWTVVRADNDPLHQGVPNPAQQGVVCLNGTVCPGPPTTAVDTRNLLDFNEVTVDSAGRIIAVYADGCNFEHPCININDNSADRESNQGTARITIIRQRGGTRLFGAFDPPPGPPSNPFVEAQPVQKGVQLLWGTPAENGAPIKEYRIYRGSPGKPERLVTKAKPSINTLVDKNGKPGDYYHVTSVNKFGESHKPAKTVVKRRKSNAR